MCVCEGIDWKMTQQQLRQRLEKISFTAGKGNINIYVCAPVCVSVFYPCKCVCVCLYKITVTGATTTNYWTYWLWHLESARGVFFNWILRSYKVAAGSPEGSFGCKGEWGGVCIKSKCFGPLTDNVQHILGPLH